MSQTCAESAPEHGFLLSSLARTRPDDRYLFSMQPCGVPVALTPMVCARLRSSHASRVLPKRDRSAQRRLTALACLWCLTSVRYITCVLFLASSMLWVAFPICARSLRNPIHLVRLSARAPRRDGAPSLCTATSRPPAPPAAGERTPAR
eukprot:5320650-Prymnesium_polylepis.1